MAFHSRAAPDRRAGSEGYGAKDAPVPARSGDVCPDAGRVAVLIASHDGEATIADAVDSAVSQADVFVISDGSRDQTAAVARRAGAHVLELDENVGKPGALFRALFAWELPRRYEAIAILDDDTVIAGDFVTESMKQLRSGVGIVVGQTQTRWPGANPWNAWLNSRTYSYWRYQLTVRRGQSAFNAINCISGSNSLYRSELLDRVLRPNTPYIVDDTYWTLETHRRNLGRIVYASRARAWVQDPTTMRDWYQQNLRWLWGSMQGIVGHRIGTRRTAMDFFYILLIVDWVLYVLGAPVLLAVLFGFGLVSPAAFAPWYFGGYFVWVAIAAVVTHRWRMVLLTPALIAIDWLYRVNFLHAAVRTLRQPRVTSCVWASPSRYDVVSPVSSEGGAA